jgi:tetratricopeptide (TPR) repeat protein
VVAGAVLMMLIALLWPRPKSVSGNANSPDEASAGGHSGIAAERPKVLRRFGVAGNRQLAKSAEEIVAEKVRLFGQKRRAIAERIAHRLNKDLPPEIDAFFKAIDKGDWDEIRSRWQELATHTHQYTYSKSDRPDLEPYWATVLDAYGVAEQAHNWPAQALLDYGNAILDSLRPGMVYVGGTDDGRWVPELLNETSGGDPHIMVTQNALADSTYLDYVRELYGDQFNPLSPEDLQRGFQDYIADAQKRLQHDLDFPNEPKQVLPGENITMVDGHAQATGMTAVMGINEKLLQILMEKNPDLSFAMQESAPLRNTYADALPDGPLMELNAQSDQNSFTADLATQSVDYWRSTTQGLLADPAASGSSYTLKAYSHDINATANLLAAHHFTAQAEDAYSLASQMWPGNPEPVNGLAQMLAQTGHADEARQLLDQFASRYPDQQKGIAQARAVLWTMPPAH